MVMVLAKKTFDNMDHFNNNKIDEDDVNLDEIQFEYNFIDIPWDDRSRNSKIGIVSLLVAIFVATMALVINNFVMHYKNYGSSRNTSGTEISCYRVKMDEYPFVARIHSVSTKDLLCVGAVVSATSVLASGVCAQSGAIKVHLGTNKEPRCKKGFPINVIEPMYHDGVISKRLVLLTSYESLARCSKPIAIGRVLDRNIKVNIIGRPLRGSKLLSRQFVKLANKQYQYDYLGSAIKNLNKENILCVTDLARCPVQAGDLLVQRGRLFGIAATSVQRSDRNQLACFAAMETVKRELKELDEDIDIGRFDNESRRSVKSH